MRKEDNSPVTDWSWTCRADDSCWNKFHNFYQPHGLCNKHFSLAAATCKFSGYVYTSPLYQKKYAALGISVTKKRGREAGMGRINERDHIVLSDIELNEQKTNNFGGENESDDNSNDVTDEDSKEDSEEESEEQHLSDATEDTDAQESV